MKLFFFSSFFWISVYIFLFSSCLCQTEPWYTFRIHKLHKHIARKQEYYAKNVGIKVSILPFIGISLTFLFRRLKLDLTNLDRFIINKELKDLFFCFNFFSPSNKTQKGKPSEKNTKIFEKLEQLSVIRYVKA